MSDTSASGLRCRAAPIAAGLLLALVVGACTACADEVPAPPRFESWSGLAGSENAWFAYGGIVAAPFGSVLEDGLRLRLQGGGGRYAADGSDTVLDARALGQSTLTEGLVGLQQRFGATIAKVYAGAVYDVRSELPLRTEATSAEAEIGGKAIVELWHDWGESAWLSLDLSYATPGSTYDAEARAAYRLLPGLSLGVEAAALGNADFDQSRLGLLAKWDTSYGELTLSGGASGDRLEPSLPYGNLSVLSRF